MAPSGLAASPQGRIFGGVATRRMPEPVNIAVNCAVTLEFTA
jgi:hypothetical protein